MEAIAARVRVLFWWWVSKTVFKLRGHSAAYGWAHVKWLNAHTRFVFENQWRGER